MAKCERCSVENRGVISRIYKWFVPGDGWTTYNFMMCIKCDRQYKHQKEENLPKYSW